MYDVPFKFCKSANAKQKEPMHNLFQGSSTVSVLADSQRVDELQQWMPSVNNDRDSDAGRASRHQTAGGRSLICVPFQ